MLKTRIFWDAWCKQAKQNLKKQLHGISATQDGMLQHPNLRLKFETSK